MDSHRNSKLCAVVATAVALLFGASASAAAAADAARTRAPLVCTVTASGKLVPQCSASYPLCRDICGGDAQHQQRRACLIRSRARRPSATVHERAACIFLPDGSFSCADPQGYGPTPIMPLLY